MRIILLCAIVYGALLSGCSSNTNDHRFNNQKNIDPIQAAKTRISLALTYLENGNVTEAKANLDKALEFASFLPDVHHSYAYYYQTVGEVKRANQSYQAALTRAPNDPNIINSYGAFLCETGNFDEAESYLLAAVSAPNYTHIAQTYENLAICAQADIRLADSIGYLEKALNYEPERVKSLRLMAELLIATDQWDIAKPFLRRLEKTGGVTAQSLLMWVQVEHALGNVGAAHSYGETLTSLYGDSPQSRTYHALMNPPKASVSVNKETHTVASSSAPDGNLVHIVKAGENLYRISLLYQVKIQKLIEWNNLTDASSIQVGRELIVNKSEY